MTYGASTDTCWPISKAFKDDGQSSAPYRSLFPSLWDKEHSSRRKADATGKWPILKMKKDTTIHQALGYGINLPRHFNKNNRPGLSLACDYFKVISVGIA